MLNEERVKYMTKLAFYETKDGNEDLKISFQYKNDYIGFHTFWAGLWMTLAYIAFVVMIITAFMGGVFETLSSQQLIIIILAFLGIYFILLLLYIRYAKYIYKKKHARAYHRMKKFKDELEQLETMYDKEDSHE